MTNEDLIEFRNSILQDVKLNSNVNMNYQKLEFLRYTTNILSDAEEFNDFQECHYEGTDSHNRKFGEMFIQGKKYTKLAEGVATTRALVKLGEKYNVDLPITNAIDLIVNKNHNPNKVLSNLFLRSIKKEF